MLISVFLQSAGWSFCRSCSRNYVHSYQKGIVSQASPSDSLHALVVACDVLHPVLQIRGAARFVSSYPTVWVARSTLPLENHGSCPAADSWKPASHSGGSRVWKGGFHVHNMCTVATTPPFDAHVHRCNESDCA